MSVEKKKLLKWTLNLNYDVNVFTVLEGSCAAAVPLRQTVMSVCNHLHGAKRLEKCA